MKEDSIRFINRHKIIAIARGLRPEDMVNTAKALYDGGIRLLEITFNQSSPSCMEDTIKSIKLVCAAMGSRMMVGAGTVLTVEQATVAKEAGAVFILAPNVDIPVIRESNRMGMVSIPGAMTPTEACTAYNAGADFIKIFPAGALGLDYLKAVMVPLNHIPMYAVGGVDEDNIRDYFSIGLKGVGIGSNIVKRSLIEAENFSSITALAKRYTDAIQ